jgi:hypothetical protein
VRLALALVLLAACGAKKESEDYIRKSKSAEAHIKLKSLALMAKNRVLDTGALPAGSAGPTPSQPCCSSADKKCAADAADWKQPVWEQLDFYSDAPGYFQYSYQSDGTSFTASATGDPLCDGRPLTLTITGKIDASKELVVDESQLATPKK